MKRKAADAEVKTKKARLECLPSFSPGRILCLYSWNPGKLQDQTEKRHTEVTVKDVLEGVQMEGITLPKLVEIHEIELPLSLLENLPPQAHRNVFPHDGGYIVPLYVAAQYGVELSRIDFLLGGSTLNVLASRSIEEPHRHRYLAQKVPGTEIIVCCKSAAYTVDYASVGFQFERLLTGGELDGKHGRKKFESLRLAKIGKYWVLFSAEIDAVDQQGEPVEMKSGKEHSSMKVMFQMLASGCQKVVACERWGLQLKSIFTRRLSEIMEEQGAERLLKADGNICKGLEQLKASVGNEPMELSFLGLRKEMQLAPCPEGDVLPSQKVIKKLLAT